MTCNIRMSVRMI